MGIDASQPRLGWIVESDVRGQRQSAYRILVASDPGQLHDDHGNLWDSGKITSNQTTEIVYAGVPLRIAQAGILEGENLGQRRRRVAVE